QLEATILIVDKIVSARIDVKTRVKSIEIEENLAVQACANQQPSINMSATMRSSYTGNGVNIDVNADVGLDVASTGSM
ncbi:hypothetical protein C0995_003702, partial [Termitomyces sp. Mi166